MHGNDVGVSIKDLVPNLEGMASTRPGEHYDVVSTVGYLLGVQKKYFESETHTMDLEIYRKLLNG